MNLQESARPQWKTSSFGGAADTTPAELSALRTHMDRCGQSRGRLFGLLRAADGLDGLVGRHPVTVVMLVFLAMWMMMFVTSLMH
ncbi:MAG: hypothetical protein ABI671_20600 [Burkholderiales bacterium]